MDEVFKELFGVLGRKDGTRFLTKQEQDPQQMQMMQTMQAMQSAIMELQHQLKDKEADRQVKLMDRQMSEEGQNIRKQAELEAQVNQKVIAIEADKQKMLFEAAVEMNRGEDERREKAVSGSGSRKAS
jgi:hypothetical protein